MSPTTLNNSLLNAVYDLYPKTYLKVNNTYCLQNQDQIFKKRNFKQYLKSSVLNKKPFKRNLLANHFINSVLSNN